MPKRHTGRTTLPPKRIKGTGILFRFSCRHDLTNLGRISDATAFRLRSLRPGDDNPDVACRQAPLAPPAMLAFTCFPLSPHARG
jgi:hypothetical protein